MRRARTPPTRSPSRLLATTIAVTLVAGVVSVFAVDRSPSEPGLHPEQAATTTVPHPVDVPVEAPPPTEPPVTEPAPAAAEPAPEPAGAAEPARPAADRVLRGQVSLAGFEVPAGQRWRFDPGTSTTVEVNANVVVRGVLEMRPASPDVVHTLRFVGVDESRYQGGGNDVLASDVGLWVVDAGQLDLAGSPKRAWLRADGSLAQGARDVPLDGDPAGWRPGDEVLVTATLPPSVKEHFATDDLAVVDRAGGSGVRLAAGTAWAHPAVGVSPGRTMAAEVANLTRNVNVEGTPGGRAHVLIRSSRPQRVDHATIRHMGPRRFNGKTDARGPISEPVLGRYALHFHRSGDGSRGSSVEGTVVRDIGNHGFVPHDSHGVTFRDSVGYDIVGDGFWWDDLPFEDPDFDRRFAKPQLTHDTLVEGCLIARIRAIPDYQGRQAAAFVAASGNGNVMRGNVASGVEGNVNSSGFKWREGDGDAGVWTFEDNVTHNNKVEGIWIWQVTRAVHPIVRLTAYHNGNAGVMNGAYANNFRFVDGVLHGNGGQLNGTQLLAFAGSFGGSDAGEALAIQGMWLDAAGLTPHALKLSGRSAVDPAGNRSAPRGYVSGNTFRGYTESAVKVTFDFHDFGPFATSWALDGNDFGPGRPFRFTDDIHESTAVGVGGLGDPFTLRRADQEGRYEAEWNARRSW